MAGLAVASAIVCMTLPETYNQPTLENLSQDEKASEQEKDENETAEAAKEEETTFVWRKNDENYLWFITMWGELLREHC